jgi:predicted DNA-binding transcriptional regulator AlpA
LKIQEGVAHYLVMTGTPYFLSVSALAERWGVRAAVIYGLRYKGQAPRALRIGRELRFRLEDVERWELAHRDNGASDDVAP